MKKNIKQLELGLNFPMPRISRPLGERKSLANRVGQNEVADTVPGVKLGELNRFFKDDAVIHVSKKFIQQQELEIVEK